MAFNVLATFGAVTPIRVALEFTSADDALFNHVEFLPQIRLQ